MQLRLKVLGFALPFALAAQAAFAHVSVVTERRVITESDSRTFRVALAQDLAAGAYDRAGLSWPVVTARGVETRTITATLFNSLPVVMRNALVDRLADYAEALWQTYTVKVDADSEDLSGEAALDRLGIDRTALSGQVAAEQLLSPFARRWAYQDSGRNGPNCWHTSMASIFLDWNDARYMSPEEFACHLRTSFERLPDETTPEELQFGDLIRLSYGDTSEVHGFTYIGVDHADPTRHIVFTKNGYARSDYDFMSLDTVHNEIYSGTEISFWRPTQMAIDPNEDAHSPCYDEFEQGQPVFEGNPLVTAGFKKHATDVRIPLGF